MKSLMRSFNTRKRYLLLALVSVFIISTMLGCLSTVKLVDFKVNDRVPLEAGKEAPYHGMLISFEDYEWFLRCENYIEQNRVLP